MVYPVGEPRTSGGVMARATRELVDALRATASRLRTEVTYQWTHMGACNCGHLAQVVTGLPAAEIRRVALEKAGEWGDQAIDHCPGSGYPIDHILEKMLELGLSRDDIGHLEKLSDGRVLRQLPEGARHLDYRNRLDVVTYMEAWASLLEQERSSSRESAGERKIAA